MLLSKCAVCDRKNSKFIKEQKASGLLTSLAEIHLRQRGFTYSACGAFTKDKKRIQKLKKAGDSRHICQKKKLGKGSFQHDMAYGGFKNLTRGTASNKILRDKASNVAKNPKCDGYQKSLLNRAPCAPLLLGALPIIDMCLTRLLDCVPTYLTHH